MPSNGPPVCDCEVIHANTVDKVMSMMPPGKDLYDLANLYQIFSDHSRVRILWALNCSEM